MIQCSRCAKQTISHARFCPRCGLSTAFATAGAANPPVRIPPPVVPWTTPSIPARQMKPEKRQAAPSPKAQPVLVRTPVPKPAAKPGKNRGWLIIAIVGAMMAARGGFFTSKKSATPSPVTTPFSNYNSLNPPAPYPMPPNGPTNSRGVYIRPPQTGGSYAPPYPLPPQGRPSYFPPEPNFGGRPYSEPSRFNPSTGRYETDAPNRR